MKNIIFLAPPAAGKGTLSEMLVEKFGYGHISTGDLLREEVAKKSELGLEAEGLMKAGKYVPDELIIKLIDFFKKLKIKINIYSLVIIKL